MVINHWQDSGNGSKISPGEVQIWSANMNEEKGLDFLDLLSDAEKKRAARLKNSLNAHQQMTSRGILRIVLGRYLGVKPEALVFACNPQGKPFLVFPETEGLSFNLSHSGQLLLIATGSGAPIGVDVEWMVATADFAGISALAFSDSEKRALLESSEPVADFYAIWTAKEAVLKAAGSGFAYPSSKFCVVISEGKTTLTDHQAELTQGLSCSLISFNPASGYSAALAVLR
jgi:4'-phosphopantetheinyl transferase